MDTKVYFLISSLGKKQSLCWQLCFPLLSTLAERTSSGVWLSSVCSFQILEFIVLQIHLRLFSPSGFASLQSCLCICQVMLNLKHYWENPPQLLLSPKYTGLFYSLPVLLFHFLSLNVFSCTKFTDPNHSLHSLLLCSAVSSYICSPKWKRKARVFVAQWWLYDTSGNMAHTFKAAAQNKAVWTNQVILTWN